jgi:hypothetical protein
MSERLDALQQDEEAQDRRIEYIKGLRGLADFIEAYPDLPLPYGEEYFNIWVYTKEEVSTLVRGKGKWEKIAETNQMVFRKKFGPLNYDINITRDRVCEKIVVGQEIIPARPATPEQVIDKIEWRCAPVLDHEVDEELGQS